MPLMRYKLKLIARCTRVQPSHMLTLYLRTTSDMSCVIKSKLRPFPKLIYYKDRRQMSVLCISCYNNDGKMAKRQTDRQIGKAK